MVGESIVNDLRHFIICILVFAGLFLNSGCSLDISKQQIPSETWSKPEFCKQQFHEKVYFRTELYFGLSKPNGWVTEEEFQNFVKTEVTPRFPNGLTLLNAKGQFEDSTGRLIIEDAKLLILFYSFSPENNSRIERIREKYKKIFQQESVMRVDGLSCVSF